MSNVLMAASNQWSSRPADERFSSLADMHDAANAFAARGRQARLQTRELRVVAEGAAVRLQGKRTTCELTHWSFGQLAQQGGAPGGYLRTLPAQMAADCLNYGLERHTDSDDSLLLVDDHGDDSYTLRAITSDRYSRIWNKDITSRLLDLEASGPFRPAPPAFDGSRGLYLGDRDMFAFLVDNDRRIFETDKNGGLGRGFFVTNSETGAGSFAVTSFLYEYVCGNHRVWGAKDVRELRFRHVGNAIGRGFAEWKFQLRAYAERSAGEDEAKIRTLKDYSLGGTKDEVLDRIFGLKLAGMSKRLAAQAYDLAEKRVDWYGSPRSAWGYVGGLTEIARDLPNADERVAMERVGAKIMEIAL